MTRKDYQIIANCLNDVHEKTTHNFAVICARTFIISFNHTYPNFNEEQFKKALTFELKFISK